MTTTIVYANTDDGYLWNNSTDYNDARTGNVIESLDQSSDRFYIGQSRPSGSAWQVAMSFIRFAWSAIPDTERVTAAAIALEVASVDAPSVSTNVEVRAYTWSGSGLQTSDWNPPFSLNARVLGAEYVGANQGFLDNMYAGSDALLLSVIAGTSYEAVVVTDRQRNGNVPTGPEMISIYSANAGGTASDPALVWTSVARSTLYGVAGAQVQMPDGSAWVFIESNGAVAPTLTVKHRNSAGTVTTVGGATSDFAAPNGAQAYALAVDPSGNIFLIGPSSTGGNVLAVRPFQKMGGLSWTPLTTRFASLPINMTAINNTAAAYHAIGTAGAIMVVNGHTHGPGAFTGTPWGVTHVALSVAYLLTGTGSLVLHSGHSSGSLIPGQSTRMYSANETGSGLDVAAAGSTNPTWGYMLSLNATQAPAENDGIPSTRYILNSSGTALAHASYSSGSVGWALKDAGAKVRVVPISSTAAAFITADADTGWGITVSIRQHSGTTAGSVELAKIVLGQQGITGMPDGPALGASLAWDAVYNSVENRLWLYFVDSADAGRLLRTPISLSSMQAEVFTQEVWNAPGAEVIQAVRVQRGAETTQHCLVTIAHSTTSTVYVLDLFNLAPTAPTLTPRANYDATTAATFAWTFNDPNPGDTQSAYQLVIERTDTGAVVLDTGKVASTTPSRNVTGGTLANSLSYRWRVSTWDAQDEQSPYSDYGTFSTSAGGTVTITSPATDNPPGIVTDDIAVTWSVSGTTQAGYRVWLYRGATLVSDTGWVTSTATTHTVAGMLSDEEHTIQVRVRNGSSVESGTGSRLVTPSFGTPEKPSIVLSANSDQGYIAVAVTNPPPGAPVAGGPEWDFESAGDVTNWVATDGTSTHSTAQAHKGTGSLLLTVTGSPAQAYIRNAIDAPSVTPGERYTARMWVYSPEARNVVAAIDWMNGGSYVTSSVSSTAVPANTWTYVTVTGTCPATATLANFGPTLEPNPDAGDLLYIDEIILTGASDRPEVSSNDILRRATGSTGAWEVIGSCGPDGTFLDYTAASGVSYDYIARGVA